MRYAQPAQLFARAYNAKRCRGVWGNAPPGFLNLGHMRVLLKPSETIITTQNLWKLDFGDSSYGRVSEPLPFGINHCVVPPLFLGSCRFECFMFTGHEAADLYGDVCCV